MIMHRLYRYVVETLTPMVLDGLVAVVIVPIIVTGYRYSSQAWNKSRPTQTIVCPSEARKKIHKVKSPSSLIIPFHTKGYNSQAWSKIRPNQTIVCQSEVRKKIYKVKSSSSLILPVHTKGLFILSALEAEYLGPRICLRIKPMFPQGFMRANSSTSDESIDVANRSESLGLAIMEKQNLLKQVLGDYQNLNYRIYHILNVVSENWREEPIIDTQITSNFKVYNNPCYEPNDLDVSTYIYFGISSGPKRLFHNILEFAGLEEDVNLLVERICFLEPEFQDTDFLPEAETTIKQFFEKIKGDDLGLQESHEQALISELNKLKKDLSLLIRQNRYFRSEVLWELENYFLKTFRRTLELRQQAINDLRQEIASLEKIQSEI